jgi:aspartate/methionine/tyrosine aminotransferase
MLYGHHFDPGRFFITVGGMHALSIAARMVAGDGGEVIVPTPAWPNIAAAMELTGARAVAVPMSLEETGWVLDPERIAAAIVPGRTRAIVVNTPGNPTGFTADLATISALLDLARRHGLWIIADEVYGRFTYSGARAASFHDVAHPDDKVLFVNTFSKNWAMTGWRVGWLEAPAALGSVIENLIQYTTSGVPAFLQRGAIAALAEGEPFVALQIARAERGRAILGEALAATNRVRFAMPPGAFYLFLSVDGHADTNRLAFRLVDEAGVGVAPGPTFGAGGEAFVRLCFARDENQIAIAAERLVEWLRTA